MNLPAFYAAVRPVFGGTLTQEQVDGINLILEAFTRYGDGDPRKLAYILATAEHESAHTMQALKETGNAANPLPTDAKVKERLTKAWKAGKMPWVKKDYWSGGWFGRGLVQLTHRDNYDKLGKALGIDLVSDPSKALVPEISAAVLVKGMMDGLFTGKKLADFPSDFHGARAIVNGSDKAGVIRDLAYAFLAAIEAAADTPPEPKPAPIADRGPLVAIALLIGAILAGIGMFATATWSFLVNLLNWIF